MAGPETLGDVAVVLRPLIDIVDRQGDGRARRQPLEDTGQDPHLIRLLPLRREARLTGAAAVEEGLDIRLAERNARRAAIHDAADRGPVALTPGSDAEQMAEGVVGHAGRVSPPLF